jgi:hypothetical protein
MLGEIVITLFENKKETTKKQDGSLIGQVL